MRSAGPDPEWRCLIGNRLLHNSGWGTAPLQSHELGYARHSAYTPELQLLGKGMPTKQPFQRLNEGPGMLHRISILVRYWEYRTAHSYGQSCHLSCPRCWQALCPVIAVRAHYLQQPSIHCEGGSRCPLYTPLRRTHLGSFSCLTYVLLHLSSTSPRSPFIHRISRAKRGHEHCKRGLGDLTQGLA